MPNSAASCELRELQLIEKSLHSLHVPGVPYTKGTSQMAGLHVVVGPLR
jgi:hypothetical protein